MEENSQDVELLFCMLIIIMKVRKHLLFMFSSGQIAASPQAEVSQERQAGGSCGG